MRRNGFTLIELLVVLAIVGIVGTMIFSGVNSNAGYTYGLNGLTESRCIDGYKFIVGQSGSAQQVLDNNGNGVPCE